MRENIEHIPFLCGECGHELVACLVGYKSKAAAGRRLKAAIEFAAEAQCPSCGAAVEFRFDHLKQYKWEDNE